MVSGPQRRQLRRRVRLQLLQRRVGAGHGPHALEGRRRAQLCRRGLPAHAPGRLPGLQWRPRAASTRTGRRSRISTRCRSSRTPTAASEPRSSASCRTSTSRSAGLFKKSSPPPGRTQPPCVKKSTPWQGKIKVVKNGVITKRSSSSHVTEAAPHATAPSRSSACGGSVGGSAEFRPYATSISTSRTANAVRSSARTAPARRRSSTSSPATSSPRPERSR